MENSSCVAKLLFSFLPAKAVGSVSAGGARLCFVIAYSKILLPAVFELNNKDGGDFLGMGGQNGIFVGRNEVPYGY